LTKRIRVNLVYDPSKAFLNKDANPLSMSDLIPNDLQPLNKAQSHHPAFMQLADKPMDSAYSKVFIKRNFLYTELKSVLISVE
jgi:hypothetical protein